jgi:hypothetical protein
VTEAVFLATVGFVFAALLAGVRRAEQHWLGYTTLCGLAWLGFTAALAAGGWLGQFDARPPHFFVLMLPTALATLALAFSPFGARLAERVGWAGLLGFQIFRLPVEWVLASLASSGVAPPQMTWPAGTDVLTGLSARSSRGSRRGRSAGARALPGTRLASRCSRTWWRSRSSTPTARAFANGQPTRSSRAGRGPGCPRSGSRRAVRAPAGLRKLRRWLAK